MQKHALTFDQVRTLDAIARLGSAARAAEELGRVASGVLYQMKQLEDAVGLPVFDRSTYRTGLTPFGRGLLEQCRPLLATLVRIERYCDAARLGFEPTLKVVFDGLVPMASVLSAVRHVAEVSPETRVSLYSEYLGEVETRARREQADLAVAVVPFAEPFGTATPLVPLRSVLVVASSHPLAALDPRPADANALVEALSAFPLLTVRGSDPRLGMMPPSFRPAAELRLSDFGAKREALLAGMGWGWMPSHLVADALADGRLVHLVADATAPEDLLTGVHDIQPVLHRHRDHGEGRAASAFVAGLVAAWNAASREVAPNARA
jgi:DNA-binding transcriptional LysR family regulator